MVRLDDDNGFLIQEGTATTLLQGSIFLFTSSVGLMLPEEGDDGEVHSTDNEALSIVSYRIEWNMRHALKPTYETLFEMLKYSSWRVAFFVHPMC
uniref:Uncharacterized protein n=1 Tax=Brassica campestris TaxID=3711 RepID=A0A3P6B2E8_BRACM|nr:unnamed protein product [Brassica rapa]